MKMIIQDISILVAVVIGVAVIIPVISSITSDPEITGDLPDGAVTLINILPIFIAIAMIMVVVGLFGFGDSETSDEEEEEEEEPEPVMVQKKKAQKSAYEILAEKYAKGEISDEEYTNKMARL